MDALLLYPYCFYVLIGNFNTYWWSDPAAETAWWEVDLHDPRNRIEDEESRHWFEWKYQEKIELNEEIGMEATPIQYHVFSVVIHWYGWYAAKEYKVLSSNNGMVWDERAYITGRYSSPFHLFSVMFIHLFTLHLYFMQS